MSCHLNESDPVSQPKMIEIMTNNYYLYLAENHFRMERGGKGLLNEETAALAGGSVGYGSSPGKAMCVQSTRCEGGNGLHFVFHIARDCEYIVERQHELQKPFVGQKDSSKKTIMYNKVKIPKW